MFIKCIYCNKKEIQLPPYFKSHEENLLYFKYMHSYYPYSSTGNRLFIKDTILSRTIKGPYYCNNCGGNFMRVTDKYVSTFNIKKIHSQYKFFIKTKEPCNTKLFLGG
jgi:hypothetical protein